MKDFIILDHEFVLEIVDNDLELLQMLIKNFLKNIPLHLKDLEIAIYQKDTKQLRYFAHKIKGGCLNLGGKKVSNTSHKIELAAIDNHLENVPHLYEALKHEIEEFISSLTSFEWENALER